MLTRRMLSASSFCISSKERFDGERAVRGRSLDTFENDEDDAAALTEVDPDGTGAAENGSSF